MYLSLSIYIYIYMYIHMIGTHAYNHMYDETAIKDQLLSKSGQNTTMKPMIHSCRTKPKRLHLEHAMSSV